ncbi:hypothetical protein EJ06DRAFT_514695 [Trichodelitschia bisporula]|uniref:Alpha/beta-hydrolase n=1 Tax=Trichodelitschia bisporula TaxID=703511 RepID=A0A6G1HN45_9PEZI|nr:hypothetical protein EJ06DRAFT_514695 [Trichodelitschia bisporula]
MTAADLAHPGTGPYPAGPFTDATLPGHTIFAPLVPPPVRVLMPVFLWAGAGCIRAGSLYAPFLSEIASHGYLVIATGNPLPPVTVENGTLGWQALSRALAQPASHPGDLSAALEWVVRRRPTRFGGVDSQAILMGGHSCGGLEVYSAAWREARVRGLMLFNSGTLDVRTRALLAEERVPVAYFTGGRTDGAEGNAEADYRALPEGLPAFKASLDTGHAGTLFSRNGGKYGKAAVEYLQWRVRGISRAKDACLRPDSPGSLVGDGWRVGFKNWLPTEKVGDSEEDDEEEGEPAAR